VALVWALHRWTTERYDARSLEDPMAEGRFVAEGATMSGGRP
jgi:hypothetical protein